MRYSSIYARTSVRIQCRSLLLSFSVLYSRRCNNSVALSMCRRCRSVSRICSIVRWASASRLGAGAGDGDGDASRPCPVLGGLWPSSKRSARSCLNSMSSTTRSISARLTAAVSPGLGWPPIPCLRASASKALSLSSSLRCSFSSKISRNRTSCAFASP